MTKTTLHLILALAALTIPLPAQEKKWTPPPVLDLPALIENAPEAAATAIRSSWGKQALASGKKKWIEKTTVLWAVTSQEPVALFKKAVGKGQDPEKIADLVKLDDQGLHALARDLGNHQRFDYELKTSSDKKIGSGQVTIEYYDAPPEALRSDDVPRGKLHPHVWENSRIFPGTRRDFLVYIPEQYDGKEPAALMVFQDGLRHADTGNPTGLRVPAVLDHLIHAGDMPVTVGVFINPGSLHDQKPGSKPRNRSFEYDSLGDAYATFLLEEILPFVTEEHGLDISADPALRAIAGGSSGCACAWTAAWERPGRFGKVLGWVGTFTDIRGAHVYPALIRKTEPKPIRAALLGENNDNDNRFGHWPLANRQMDAALQFADYDYRYWWGDGFHGSRHAAVMLPEMLRWLWSDIQP